MYTLEELRDKNLNELKEIGWQLNVLPAGDKRRRQNWIDALVGVNPPLLQLLEVSPAAEVESVSEPIESPPEALECPGCGAIHSLFTDPEYLEMLNRKVIRCLHCNYTRPKNYPGPIQSEAAEPIAQAAETSPGVDRPIENFTEVDQPPNRGDSGRGRLESAIESCQEELVECPLCGGDEFVTHESQPWLVVECPFCVGYGFVSPEVASAIEVQASEPIESKFGRIVCPKVSVKLIAQAAETSPGVDRPIENFTEVDQPPNRGDSGRGRLESEPKLSQSAIGSAAKNFLDAEADDRNPILTGCTFSDNFLARYSPPQSQIFHFQADVTGQLSLLDFEVESTDEPPDPDDFEGMLAFWAAYDAWCERTDDDSEQFEPLEISLTSMCEWAPCPLEWYEPAETNETNETVSYTLEISPVSVASAGTSKFLIPVFDAWCDRPNGKDEPPTAGVGARLPKPKPPSFPPMVVAKGDGVPPRKLRTNGKKFARSATLLSGRAPPGGDAM